MVLKYNFRGIIAPVFTPFTENLELNLDLIPKYAEHLKNVGVKAVLVGGTTGEGVSMSVPERRAAAEAWARAVTSTRQSLVIQVGGAALTDVQAMAKHAESLKVNALLCLPELFFRPGSVDELVDYLVHVSKAAPKTPLLYYHIPSFTGVDLNMEEFLVKGRARIPTFAGIKFTCNDLEHGARCLRVAGDDLTVFLGADQIFAGACALGFDSAIVTTANLWPRLFDDIYENCVKNNSKESSEIQEKLAKLTYSIVQHGSWVSTMKMAMTKATGLDMGPPRPPLARLNASQGARIENDLKQSQLF